MKSENYKKLLILERHSPELSDAEYEDTLMHFAKLYHQEQLKITPKPLNNEITIRQTIQD